jgi:hypothetical protein
MAFPVIATAVVLTGGWLLVSRERATNLAPRGSAPGAPSTTTVQVREHGDNPVGGAAPERVVGTFTETEPGWRQYRGTPEGFIEPVAPDVDPTTSPSHAASGTVVGTADVAETETPSPHASAEQTYQMAYGISENNLKGTSKAQQAELIAKYGASIGAVW